MLGEDGLFEELPRRVSGASPGEHKKGVNHRIRRHLFRHMSSIVISTALIIIPSFAPKASTLAYAHSPFLVFSAA